jgi:hypothetical protein
MIFAGGCRSKTDIGHIEEKHCNECQAYELCELEPRARQMAKIVSEQWVRTSDMAPSRTTPLLYLEYPSFEPNGTLHLGHFDRQRRRFVEQGTGETLSEHAVIAWMPVPPAPVPVQREVRISRTRNSGLYFARPEID